MIFDMPTQEELDRIKRKPKENAMTRAAWADKKVYAIWGKKELSWKLTADLLLAEHKRAVRVVKRLEKAAKLGKYSLNNDQFAGYMGALRHVLAALQKGRT